MLQPRAKEDLKLGREAPAKEGRNLLDVAVITVLPPRQFFSTVTAGGQNQQGPTRSFSLAYR